MMHILDAHMICEVTVYAEKSLHSDSFIYKDCSGAPYYYVCRWLLLY